MVCLFGLPTRGTSGRDEAYDLAIDTADNLYVTGVIGGPMAQFGTHTLTNNSPNWAMFIAKLVQWPLGVQQVFIRQCGGLCFIPILPMAVFKVSWGKGQLYEGYFN